MQEIGRDSGGVLQNCLSRKQIVIISSSDGKRGRRIAGDTDDLTVSYDC